MLYENLRNDKLDARNFFAANKPPLRWNVFGGSLGGPVIKNKTFFFSHVEFQRQRVGVVRNLTVPTDLQRAGDFSQTTNAAGALTRIYDPATYNAASRARTPFPNNIIPSSRFDPVGAKLASYFPVANRAPTNLAGANNFNRNAVSALNITTWTSKADHIFSERDRISVRYVLHDFPTFITPAYDEPAADPNASNTGRRAHSLLFNETHTFSPTMLNDFRFNWQPRSFHPTTLSIDQGWPTKLGLKGVSDRAFPRVNTASYAAMGSTTQERVQMPDPRHSPRRHALHLPRPALVQSGRRNPPRPQRRRPQLLHVRPVHLRRSSPPPTPPPAPTPATLWPACCLGFPNSANVLDSDLLDRRAKYFALFLQDDWKVSPDLTLNLGTPLGSAHAQVRRQQPHERLRPARHQPRFGHARRHHLRRTERPRQPALQRRLEQLHA